MAGFVTSIKSAATLPSPGRRTVTILFVTGFRIPEHKKNISAARIPYLCCNSVDS